VLESGVALLESGGYGALTIGALCKRAGVTPPTIYARAGNKEQLLLAIYERAMQRIARDEQLDPSDERWVAMAPAELVRAAVAQLAHVWLANAALLRPIVHRSVTDAEISRRGSEASRDLAARFRAVLGNVDVLPRDADVCFRLTYAALVQRVMYGAGFESDVALDDESFTTALGDAAVRYLQIPEGSQ
jgi:AcrR family transcriptional regulator